VRADIHVYIQKKDNQHLMLKRTAYVLLWGSLLAGLATAQNQGQSKKMSGDLNNLTGQLKVIVQRTGGAQLGSATTHGKKNTLQLLPGIGAEVDQVDASSLADLAPIPQFPISLLTGLCEPVRTTTNTP
jgi:hypothetical protein